MAVAVVEPSTTSIQMTLSNPKPLRVCFSYAAYAKNVVNYLYSSNIPVDAGLSEAEFSAAESAFNFTFPPDLRSILQEGLPVGPGFPNWRSSSQQQLEILTNLPILGICKQVSKNRFWIDSWGDRPDDSDRAAALAKAFLKNAPVLVPIYRSFYIPSTPCVAGNPVLYVHGGDVRVWSFDIAGFFQRVEFGMGGGEEALRRPRLNNDMFPAPAWAATEAREIEFWTELAARASTRGWWSGELGGCLEEVCWRLRDGGWTEEDVKEMMMIDGCDAAITCDEHVQVQQPLDAESVGWRVRSMSERLLGAGWSTEDVVELLGLPEDSHRNVNGVDDGDYCFDFRRREISCECDDKQNNTISLSF
ncbi:hypothetical protein C2S53_002821 [Perilla frutescens var. hirtella]|uniref:Knr4/Smi1-like domain-containing protein n=1 Tax=Perilla frutescens var. hirtella TaxID=608512 RepID=A0AAD4P340_PERFH|nr:hypothetical protein C2S53_002821 [Perilla frutescens var. hirtella]